MMATASTICAAAQQLLSRAECEDLLYHEAALLDDWQLDEWFALFAPGATYDVPQAGAADDISSAEALFYIADDYDRLRYRVERLKSPMAHSEWPRSDTARIIGNVRVLGVNEAGVQVRCTYVCYRSKNNVTDTFIGHCLYTLIGEPGAIRIASKRVMLDVNSLRPQGRVSIIL
ncbi:aromatic-ring-hydroxylating dioxygenase subunit beta [Sphingomonas colocasiae]|uniref:Aromatic-ring-hydroxylating dioxygenase subunit beta n=1 Tax=Sphingomonas colocasiae TaxID=1848973 RepID=A0ABS7PTL1_9SPHN|nr:aromatic-ring-hydroxylating dioxygenase subunit beta [Sphingomonas colocasiae]MBY8824329.1 aromatic-ring-hydroxylating dioxygenase subunit beta [Sphingomonas colocasiae]